MVWFDLEELSKEKRDGGMAFKNLHIFNLALLGKMRWRLIKEPNALMSRILKAKYFHNGDFLISSIGQYPSYKWEAFGPTRI